MSPRPNKPYVKSTSTPTFPSKNTMKSSKHETPSLKSSPWDSPLFSNPKFLSSKPDKKNVLKTPGSDKYKPEEKPAKIKKTSITSRIAEVDKLLQDPIIEKNIPPTAVANIKLEKSPVGSHIPVVRPYVESPPKQSTESSLSVKTESESNMLFASPKHMDDAIDAVLHRVSKEAEEAELMKFSHLIQESSSSGENSDVEVSHKTEELLQLEQRGFHHHHDDGSPVRPPLTPSPAPSNNSIIIDQDIAFTPPRKSSYREVPSLLIHTPHTHLHPDTSSERKRSTSSHSSILSHGVHEETNSHDVYEPPPSRKHSREPPEPSIDFTPTYHKKSKKDKKDREHNRSKSVKKSKHKDKEKKRSTSHERREVKPIVKDKAVEKLVLKKSKFNSPKLHKEREVTSCSFQPERLPLPKLSASIPAPLILNKEKKKEKKEKKKKK
uniref:Uncharacterized protein n=1 Tax=Ciona savignyi TaxID=51511 RepID=H2ZAJ7_CIOSA